MIPLKLLSSGSVDAPTQANPEKVAQLKKLLESLDPFELSKTIDWKLERIYQMAHHRRSPIASQTPITPFQIRGPEPLSRIEQETLKALSETFGISVYVKNAKHAQKQ